VSASLALADGKVFAINERAACAVFSATPDFKLLATNQLDGDHVLSSPVIVGDRIYIRTEKHLYSIGKK
jgi:outer membrane protein assembly factor BamB